MLKIIEVFDSIQGEGVQMGLPMTFVRLAGCNLRCSWCDTKYSWEEGDDWTEDEIVARCNQKWVCLTGGEPCYQNLNKLIAKLKLADKMITIETNGTILPDFSFDDIDFWTVSPKNSTFTNCMDALTHEFRVQWKFVVETIEQMKGYQHWVNHYLPDRSIIVYQPERFAHEVDYFEFMSEMIDLAKTFKREVRVLPQLQWLLWKGKKGI